MDVGGFPPNIFVLYIYLRIVSTVFLLHLSMGINGWNIGDRRSRAFDALESPSSAFPSYPAVSLSSPLLIYDTNTFIVHSSSCRCIISVLVILFLPPYCVFYCCVLCDCFSFACDLPMSSGQDRCDCFCVRVYKTSNKTPSPGGPYTSLIRINAINTD